MKHTLFFFLTLLLPICGFAQHTTMTFDAFVLPIPKIQKYGDSYNGLYVGSLAFGYYKPIAKHTALGVIGTFLLQTQHYHNFWENNGNTFANSYHPTVDLVSRWKINLSPKWKFYVATGFSFTGIYRYYQPFAYGTGYITCGSLSSEEKQRLEKWNTEGVRFIYHGIGAVADFQAAYRLSSHFLLSSSLKLSAYHYLPSTYLYDITFATFRPSIGLIWEKGNPQASNTSATSGTRSKR